VCSAFAVKRKIRVNSLDLELAVFIPISIDVRLAQRFDLRCF